MPKDPSFTSRRAARRAAAKGPPPDPEVEALLGFNAVHRATRRYDGWSPEIQREFIAALAELGTVREAAHSLGRTESGAYKVRTSDGAGSFAESWDAALALYHRRNPDEPAVGRPSRGRARAGAAAPPPPPAEDIDPNLDLRRDKFDSILKKYLIKLNQEREARLAGRIVEADFIVRQLTVIEIILELGEGGARLLLRHLKTRDLDVTQIVATPMSLFLDKVRRALWTAMGEPDRPPLPPLGQHDGRFATGPDRSYVAQRDGSTAQWQLRKQADAAEAAEAQRLWEEKARAESAAWRERHGSDTPGGWGEPDHDEEDGEDGEDDVFKAR